MSLKIEKLINRIEDPNLEGELLEELALLDKGELFILIDELLSHSDSLVRRFGLSLLKKLRWNKDNLLTFMAKGFLLRHPSEIRYWYEAIAPQLGIEPILNLLETYLKTDPDVVQRAWYYLNLIIRSNYIDLVDRLELTQTKFKEINSKNIWEIN